MRLVKEPLKKVSEGDLTPMIDMTFQLIAFFMVLINFSKAEQSQEIHLPSSALAKPPDRPFEEPRTVQLTRDGTILFAGQRAQNVEQFRRLLVSERRIIDFNPHKTLAMVTIIIRADRDSRTGDVQEIIKTCQEMGFEKFTLRARQHEPER